MPITLVAVLAYMAWSDWRLTLIVFLGAPLIAWIIRRFGKRMRKATTGAMVETSNLSTALMENLDGVRLIKIENREAAEQDRVGEVVARRQRHVIKSADSRAFAGPFSNLVAMIVVAAVMAGTMFSVWNNATETEVYAVSLLASVARAADTGLALAGVGQQLAEAMAESHARETQDVRAVQEVIDAHPEYSALRRPTELQRLRDARHARLSAAAGVPGERDAALRARSGGPAEPDPGR